MKYFKRIALLIVAAISAVCVGIFAAACDGDNKDNGAKEFTITVYYSDGETVVDGSDGSYYLQICLENDKVSFCSPNKGDIDANGIAKFNIATIDAQADAAAADDDQTLTDSDRIYVLHVNKIGVLGNLNTTEEVHVSKANPTAKIVLADVAAPQA